MFLYAPLPELMTYYQLNLQALCVNLVRSCSLTDCAVRCLE
jgi:hypothetical protein